MEKLNLKTFMEKEEFKDVSTCPKLAGKIGEITGKAPTDVTVWGWVNRDRKPINKSWLNALATIFKIKHGQQFFL